MRKTKKIFSLLLVLCMLLQTGLVFFADTHNNVVTNIYVTNNSGGPLGDVGQWDTFRVNINFELPDNQVNEGDTTTIHLPNELWMDDVMAFDVKDENGNVVAVAQPNQADKTVTLTYTDYPENHSGVKGKLFFYSRVDHYVVQDEQDISLNFLVEDVTVSGGTIHFKGIGEVQKYTLEKSGWKSDENSRELKYELAINRDSIEINDAVFTDTILSPMVTIKQDSLRIMKGNWVHNGVEWKFENSQIVTDQFNVQWNAEGNGFTVDFGHIAPEDHYRIRYDVQAAYDPADGEIFHNLAKLTGSNIEDKESDCKVKYTAAGGSAEGYVFTIKIHKVSEDNTPLAGAKFKVVRDATGVEVGTITTGADGDGEVGGLLKDNYTITEIEAPAGYTLDATPILIKPEDFGTDKVALKTVTNKKEETPKYKLGDYVWYDDNRDGIQEDTEKGVKGVKVTLTKPDDTTEETTTDENGYYEFEGLENGTYIVEFSNLPEGYVETLTDEGLDDSIDSDGLITTGEIKDADNMTLDLGIKKLYKLGDYVWYDDNNNGIQDADEKGVKDVKVVLKDATGKVIAETKTDENGKYVFEGLENGEYKVEFSELPEGYKETKTDEGGDDAKDSDGLTPTGVIDDADNMTLDLGIYKPETPVYSLGDYVWHDTNKNGIQDEGEKGVEGVTVTLYKVTTGGSITTPGAVTTTGGAIGTFPRTTTTDANGYYVFEGLENGRYRVEFSNLPAGYQVTLTDAGADDAKDSDGLSTEGIIKDADNMTLDLGIYQDKDDPDGGNPSGGNSGGGNPGGGNSGGGETTEPTNPKVYKLGNYVWYDDNHDGVQDPTEHGVAGIKVVLFDKDGNQIAETVTDINGRYIFTGLANGEYSVQFSNLPAGYQVTLSDVGVDTLDSDGLNPTGTIDNADNLTLDLGIYKPAEPVVVTPVEPTEPQLPRTNESLPVLPIALGMLLIVAGAGAYVWGKRTESEF